jgi:predicted  nucleic acid-binding Zn-ribbon protein
MGRQLSAKDNAFQKEREYLKKQISYWRDMVVEKNIQLSKDELKIMELEQRIADLHKQIEEHFHMTPEQFDEHIHRDMRGVEAIEYLRAMTGRFGGMY